jgi:sulfonate transport system substrate-binding protein
MVLIRSLKRRLAAGLSATAVLATATACATSAAALGGGSASGGSAGSGTSGLVLNLGDQQQRLQTLLTDSGVLKDATYKVNFVEFGSGPLVDAGFAAHRIDLGFMGDLPASLAGKSGLPVTAVAVSQSVGASEYLAGEQGITSLAQLKGKPVAYTTGTAEQALALRALKAAHLSQQDVRQVNVSLQQLGTALETRAAAASVLSVEQLVNDRKQHPGDSVLATDKTITPPSYGYILGDNASLADPARLAAVDDLLKRIVKAGNWEKAHQGQYITDYYVNVQHDTPAAARQILAAGGTETYVPITSGVQGALQQVVGLMAGAGAGSDYSVAPLFSKAASARFSAILKEVPQHG